MKYILILFCCCHIAFAAEITLSDRMRPYLSKIIGDDWTQKVLGSSNKISMPALPKIDRDAKSTAVYKKRKDVVVLSSENAKKYDRAYLQELYIAVRNSPEAADDPNFSKWVNVLNQGATREGVYRAIVLDKNYMELENESIRLSVGSLTFIQKFMAEFLGQKIGKPSLEKINFYSAKRIVVGRVLDLMDSFSRENDELYDWYALVSSDLAPRHPWSNIARRYKDPMQHKTWAKAVPEQHIKSELIIKIHALLNSLNYSG